MKKVLTVLVLIIAIIINTSCAGNRQETDNIETKKKAEAKEMTEVGSIRIIRSRMWFRLFRKRELLCSAGIRLEEEVILQNCWVMIR